MRFKTAATVAQAEELAMPHYCEKADAVVHRVKPVQCRLYPFSARIGGEPRQLGGGTGECPGIGKGVIYSRLGQPVRRRQR